MKTGNDRPKFDSLSAESVEKALALADSFLSDNGVEYDKRSLLRPVLKDVLLAYRRQGENAPFELEFRRRWRKSTVTLRVKSASLNVLEADATISAW